jgi:hypothetical protein
MTKGILVAQSRPSSPSEGDAYHRWYHEVHVPELLALEGFVSARRMAALDGESFVAVYDVDDVEVAKGALTEAQASGALTAPTGVLLDPPPSVQWFIELVDV